MREARVEPLAVPASLAPLVADCDWSRDLIGEAGAAVHRLHAPGRPDLYLKHGIGDVADAIADEVVRMRWLGRRLATPQVRGFVLDQAGAWLLMSAVPGRTAYQLLVDEPSNRHALVDALAEHLLALHAIPTAHCPFDSGHHVRMVLARARIDAGLVDEDDFDDVRKGWSAEQVWESVVELLPLEPDRVVTHGDYSLDNIMMADGRVTGLIDLGRVGVADRYQDLAILASSLDEFELRDQLFAAYAIAGPDVRKLHFHLCLDELF
jgi:aminoglycoside 3'-phosphotransferase-1